MIFKNYLKDPLATIAVNTTIFIAGCLFFGCLAFIGIVSELIREMTLVKMLDINTFNNIKMNKSSMIK